MPTETVAMGHDLVGMGADAAKRGVTGVGFENLTLPSSLATQSAEHRPLPGCAGRGDRGAPPLAKAVVRRTGRARCFAKKVLGDEQGWGSHGNGADEEA